MKSPHAEWEKYREKIERIRSESQKKKGEAWLKIPHEIFGKRLEPLSLRKLLYLEEIDSPIINEKDASIDDIITFIYVCSNEFTLDKSNYKTFRKSLIIKEGDITKDITAYVETSFRFISFGNNGNTDSDHFATGVIDLISHQYGWQADEILDMPLNQIFQIISAIVKRLSVQAGKTPLDFDPEVDKVKAQFMREINNRN